MSFIRAHMTAPLLVSNLREDYFYRGIKKKTVLRDFIGTKKCQVSFGRPYNSLYGSNIYWITSHDNSIKLMLLFKTFQDNWSMQSCFSL